MKSLTQEIYYRSPAAVQNIAITALGFKLRRERFNKAGREMASYLEKTQRFNFDQIASLQDNEFVRIARHAIETTSYYREWARENSISSQDIRSLRDLSIFPIIEKACVRENFKQFRSDSIINQFELATSGTTGSPLTVFSDKDSRSRHYAFFTRLRSQYGINSRSKRATLFGRIILKPEQNRPPFWRMDYSQNNLLMSSYHLGEENLAYYYNKLIDYNPDEIFAYPSSVISIANYIVNNNLKPINVKLLMTTAENLSSYQRKLLEKAFNGKVVNQYGCTEMAFFCADDNDGIMKFHPEHGIGEIRKTDGTVSESGSGELIATGFINYSMPIIRYAIGDEVSVNSRDNKGYQILKQVTGRIDDVIYTIDGRPVGRLDPIFKGGLGVKYAQIYQHENGKIDLNLVPDDSYINAYGESLKCELELRVGKKADIEVILLDEIAKEKNGKFRPVVSKIKR